MKVHISVFALSMNHQPSTITQGMVSEVNLRCYFLVVALALFLRLFGLDYQNLWFDEVIAIQHSQLPYKEIPNALRAGENTKPPFYFFILHEWIKLGTSDWWLRLFSALSGSAACVVAAAVGRELIADRRGWWVGLFLAFSPMHVWYSQELRMYALLTLMGFTAMWFHLRFLRSQKPADLCGYGIFALLCCYTFTYGVFVLGFCVLFSLFYRPAASKIVLLQVLAASVVAFLAFMPWVLRIVSAAAAGQGFQFVSKGPVHEAAAYSLFNLGFGSTLGPTVESLRTYKSAIFRAEPLSSALLVAGLLIVSTVLLVGAIRMWRRERNGFWFAALGLAWFWGSPLVLTLLKPEIPSNPRYAILGVLPVALLALGLTFPGPYPRCRIALAVLFGVGTTWSLGNHFTNAAHWREDGRGAVRLAMAVSPLPERLVVCPKHFVNVVERYLTAPIPVMGLNLPPSEAGAQLNQIKEELGHAERWVLIYGRTDYGDPQQLMPAWLAENFAVIERKKLTGLQVFVLGPKAPSPLP